LERGHGVEVVIAAHPRADQNSASFAGRQSFRLVTAELVRDAKFVISHTSTAMSYAVLNAKPLIFIYTDAMAAVYQRLFIREMRTYAEYLDAPIYNVDEIHCARQVAVKKINCRSYERYKYDFLTSPQSEHMSTQEIFWNAINAYCKEAWLASPGMPLAG
jgi:hypothetical protein